jgi:hypothetical protein
VVSGRLTNGHVVPPPLWGRLGGGRDASAAQKTLPLPTKVPFSAADAAGPHLDPPHKGEDVSKMVIFVCQDNHQPRGQQRSHAFRSDGGGGTVCVNR